MPDRYRIGRFITASGILNARNQSLIEANGSDVVNPASSISSVPSTTPTTMAAGW
jgi:hypothetical protein